MASRTTTLGRRSATLLIGLTIALMACGMLTRSASGARAVTLGSGAWSWFGDPRAIHYKGVRDATYTAWVAPNGRQVVASWDGQERVRTVLPGYLPPDDHAAPSLATLPDGRLMIFSSAHAGRHMDTRISSRPEDVSGWSTQRRIGTNTPGPRGYTYPNAVTLGGRKRSLYLFWRGGGWLPSYSRYLGKGRWTRARVLVKPVAHRVYTRPYVKYATNGKGALALAFSDGHPRNGSGDIRYALFRRGAFYSASGRRIGRRGAPLDPRRADVVRSQGHAAPAWVQDVALTPAGRPAVVYASYPVPRHRHIYYYATFSRGHWRRHRITPAGGPIGAVNRTVNNVRSREVYYSGGMALDHARPSTVYLSRARAGVHVVERWTTKDRGGHWRHQSVVRGLRERGLRPVVPFGLPAGERQVLWMSGTYLHYHHFSTSIKITSSILGDPPTATFGVRSLERTSTGGRTVALNPAGSHPGSGRLASGRWDFGDGSSASAAGPVRHRYARGRYFPRLVLTDATGRRDTYVRELSVR